jgi:hypothetical protein
MPHETDDDVRTVAAAIVDYLQRHPDAADTVAGVAQWWVGRHHADDAVARAMTRLVKGGVVEKHTLPDGTTVFRRGPRHVAAAREEG